MRLLILSISLILFSNCSTQKSVGDNELDKSIMALLGGEYMQQNNSTDELVLAWRMRENDGTEVLNYAVWNKATGEQLYSGTAIRGKVKWLSEWSLEVYDYPGIIDDQNPLYRYKIDLKTKRKTALSEENKL